MLAGRFLFQVFKRNKIMRTARFWEYIHGWVRISIKPGETLSWGETRETDEGWSREYIEWTHENDKIIRVVDTDGRDCDGRSSHHQESECLLENIAAKIDDDSNFPPRPEWKRISYPRSFQRDYSAEAAGY